MTIICELKNSTNKNCFYGNACKNDCVVSELSANEDKVS